ncbi:MAG: hypothetical protein ACPGTI_14715 [bacterium]
MAEAHGYSSPGKDEWNAPNEQKALSNAQNWLKCRSFFENVTLIDKQIDDSFGERIIRFFA